MSGFNYEKNADNIVIVTMDMEGQPVNTMNEEYPDIMERVLDKIKADIDNIAGIIFTSGKKTFFAGGDLKAMLKLTKADLPEFYELNLRIKRQFRELETLGKPVVAAINGAALGGGYELALACHHRIALNERSTKIGLPEVTLGLLPGGGGVVRMVRLMGLQAASPFLLEGKQLSPDKALEAGLIHELADSPEAMMKQATAFIKANPTICQPWDKPGYSIPGGSAKDPELYTLLAATPAILYKQTRGLMPAPDKILAAAVESTLVDFDTAIRIEARYFMELVVSPVAKNIISTFFFQMNELNAGGSRPDGVAPSKVNTLGVLGAGMMGSGIAYVAAKAGIKVVLKDVSSEQAEKGKSYSEGLLSKAVERGRMDEAGKQKVLDLIKTTTSADDLADCDLIIEAVFEDIELKAQVTKEAEAKTRPDMVMASNTSTLPISILAEASKDQEKFIGLHFFSPVDKMPLVEIICGKNTSDETLAKGFDFVQQIRKIPIVVNDSRGFYTSRVYGSFLDEGCQLLQDGVDPVLIESLARSVGMPVGPLAGHDEVSQKLTIKVEETNAKLDEILGTKMHMEKAAYNIAKTLIDDYNRGGKAYGGGFYDYPEGGKKHIWSKIRELYTKADVDLPHDDIKDRILFRQAIEAVRCFEEGVLTSVRDCNIGSVFGIGFPQWTGGQMQYINSYGLKAFAARAQQLADKYGERFAPPELLLKKAEAGEIFE